MTSTANGKCDSGGDGPVAPSQPCAARPSPTPPQAAREARDVAAFARRILRRAGYAPLLAVCAVALAASHDPAHAAAAGASARASAVIVARSVRIEGADTILQTGAVQQRIAAVDRACPAADRASVKQDAPGDSERAAPVAPPPCRMLVVDLP